MYVHVCVYLYLGVSLWACSPPLFVITPSELRHRHGRRVTLEVGELEVVVVQGQVVLHGREAAGSSGQVPNALVFTVQDLSEVICNRSKFHIVNTEKLNHTSDIS